MPWSCRIRLSHDQCAVRHIKADFRGLEQIRRSPLRNDDLLHIRIRHGDQKIGFQLLRRNGFRGKRKTASCLGNGNGVAAVQIDVCAVLAARIAGNRSDRAADADARRVRGQRRRTGAYAVGDGYGHIRHRDFAGHLRIGQGVCRQPVHGFRGHPHHFTPPNQVCGDPYGIFIKLWGKYACFHQLHFHQWEI